MPREPGRPQLSRRRPGKPGNARLRVLYGGRGRWPGGRGGRGSGLSGVEVEEDAADGLRAGGDVRRNFGDAVAERARGNEWAAGGASLRFEC